MQYAVELFFDKETEQKLFWLMRRVADAGLSTRLVDLKTRPHLTLACFSEMDEQEGIRRLSAFARAHAPMPAYIASIGMFTDTRAVFAAPIVTQGLLSLHEALHACMRGFDTAGWFWYLPGRWTPHCALALTNRDAPDAFDKACALLLHAFSKMSGQFASVGLVRITDPEEEAFAAPLTGRTE